MVVLLAPGCAELQDHHYKTVNRLRAHHAWTSFGTTLHTHEKASRDYRRGWVAGYYEVLTGGEDVPPVVPPKCYWGPKFQTPVGQLAIVDWYNGFQEGSLVAKSSPIQSGLPVWVDEPEPPFPSEDVLPHYDGYPTEEVIPYDGESACAAVAAHASRRRPTTDRIQLCSTARPFQHLIAGRL